MNTIQIPGICDPEAAIEKKKVEKKYRMVVEHEKGRLKIIPGTDKLDTNLYTEIQEIPESQISLMGKPVADDEFDDATDIHCDKCNSFYRSFCLRHPLYRIHDKIPQESDAHKSYAERTIPHLFTIKNSLIPNAGQGVFALSFIPIGMVFGPYKGLRCRDKSEFYKDGYAWEVNGANGVFFIDGSDPQKSNWLRFINSPRDENEQNMLAFQVSGRIYYRVIKPIEIDQELLVWYGDVYGTEYIYQVPTATNPAPPSKTIQKTRGKNPFICRPRTNAKHA